MAPISPKPCEGPLGDALPAYLSNGLIGLRVGESPLPSGMATLAGFCGEHPVRKIEAAAPTPYPLLCDLKVNGVRLSEAGPQLKAVRQAYDFATGELQSQLTLRSADWRVDIEVTTFCNRADPAVVCQEVAFVFHQDAKVELSAGIDARAIEGRATNELREVPGEDEADLDGAIHWESAGAHSTCGVAYWTELEGGETSCERPPLSGGRFFTRYSFTAGGGARRRLRQIAAMMPSVMHHRPDQQSVRTLCRAVAEGFEAQRAANRREWTELWKSRVVIAGAEPAWQARADAAFFYLMSSTHSASPASTSMFGLATWNDYHHYFGHVMWDVETFCAPPIALVQPNAARGLLDYRWRMRSAAIANARLKGRQGMQFPWQSGPSTGQEASPLPGRASWYEDHVSADVALAFLAFCRITGERRFALEQAWPVVSGVADWIADRVARTDRGYEIKASMGIAERDQPVDNPVYMNLACQMALHGARGLAERLELPADPCWAKIADRLVTPREGNLLRSYDGYDPADEKGATPDPLMAVFPLGVPLDPEVAAATLDDYLSRADDYLGSPMLSSLYGVWAARRGDRDLALRLLEDGYGRFEHGRFSQILEYRLDRFPDEPPAGPFFANMGGFLSGMLLGFPRLNLTDGPPESWPEAEVVLPSGWNAIEIERLWIHGAPHRLRAEHGRKAELVRL